ncbi:MAG: aminopeptidase P family protein [Bacilli bacterium]|nr:aminopeptidase P family protein [Bacilli bacterium]
MQPLTTVRNELIKQNADAWIVIDYENKNPSLTAFLGKKMLTRKIFMVIEREEAYIICHSIDSLFVSTNEIEKDFKILVYNTWQEMLELEDNLFSKYTKVLMDISENGLMPRVSLADYGSVKYIEKKGIEIASSCDILQAINAAYDDEAYLLQIKACEKTLKIKDEAFALIGQLVTRDGETDEYAIQQFICKRFKEEGMVYDEPPIVAIGQNASNPHYGPTATAFSKIRKGDLVLIDMWAKMSHPNAVYSDITWMGFVGSQVPENMAERFAILREAVDAGFEYLKKYYSQKQIKGFEVDDVVRSIVNKSGYGRWFTHRTGHNISVDETPHGPGANIDNYESHDERSIIDGTSFSIEPGIYAPDFGMRSETNICIYRNTPIMIAGKQEKIIAILKK